MKPRAEPVQQALTARTRADVRRALSPRRSDLLLPEINRLALHLRGMAEDRQPLRLAVLRTYTTDLLRPYWTFEALLHGFDLELYEAPYASLLTELDEASPLLSQPPDVLYLFLQWDDLDPRFSAPLASLSIQEQNDLAESTLGRFESLVGAFRTRLASLCVVSLLPRILPRELGLYDAMVDRSEAGFFAGLKSQIAAHLRKGSGQVVFAELDEVAADVGRSRLFDRRLWLTSRAPFTVSGAQSVVRHLFTYASLLKQPRAKCIVLDADNTLWGGVVGEEGLTGIALGPEYPGTAYVAFQRRLLHFQERGLLLALCTKNNPQDVLEILRNHPHQVLREQHFAAIRANWDDKTQNVRAIAEELRLGIDSFVFVDDSPYESLLLSQTFPEMTVVSVPEQPADIPCCLDDLTQLEILSLTDEDRNRTAFYAAEKDRRKSARPSSSSDPTEYLKSLQMVMTVSVNDRSHLPRLAQLTQKTNQFNLTTRRYAEREIEQFLDTPGTLVIDFSLADLFGENGIVGLAIVTGVDQATAAIDTFLMSCRTIGRRAESAFLRQVLALIAARGCSRVRAAYIRTPKNALVQNFWPSHGFSEQQPGDFEFDCAQLSDDDGLIQVVLKSFESLPGSERESQPPSAYLPATH